MKEVCIIGTGQTEVGEHWDKSILHLAHEAVMSALLDAHVESVDALFVGNMLSGALSGQENLAAAVADFSGLRNIEAVKTEAACASGAAALRMAADAIYETFQGVSFTALNALMMQRYMWQYDVPDTGLAGFSINAHRNGCHNPYAMFRHAITEEEYGRSRVISSPLSVLDSSPICDGAAAVVLCAAGSSSLPDGSRHVAPVTILGSAVATDTLAVHDRSDPLRLVAVELSTQQALAQAGAELGDVDFLELHDAFSILGAMSLEAVGYAEPGTGWRYAMDGYIDIEGDLPVSTQGGLKSRGHPVGATGVYQAVEAVKQLQGLAGPNQVANAGLGMIQNIGGSGASVFTHILGI